MKTGFFILLSTILCGAAWTSLQAQTPATLPGDSDAIRASVQALTVSGGLPQGLVTSIIQDHAGFIWMGTKGGLVRYDGYQIKVFKHNAADSSTIASDVIQSLYLDNQNRIWITYAGHLVDIFNPVTCRVNHIAPGSALGWLLKGTYLMHFSLFEDSRNRYWVVAPNLKRVQYFTWHDPAPRPVALPPAEAIVAIQQDQDSHIWICTSRALYQISEETGRPVKMADLPGGVVFQDYLTSQMVQDARGNWVIGNWGCVLVFTPRHSWKVLPTRFPDKPVRFVAKSPDGNVYINAGNQVFRLNGDDSFSMIWTNEVHPGNLGSMMIDRSNVLWAGTNTFGVRSLSLSSRGFHSFVYRNGFIFDLLHALHFPTRKVPYEENMGVSYQFRSVRDHQGNRWFINISPKTGSGAGVVTPGYLPVFRLRDDTSSMTAISTASPGWLQLAFDQKDRCWAIFFDKDSLHCRLGQIDLSAGTLRSGIPLPAIFNRIAYLTTFHDKLCIVYTRELQLYDPDTRSSVWFQDKKSFGNARLLMAVADPIRDSTLWIASAGGGLIRLNTRTGDSRAFTETSGIPDNTVYAIVADKGGYLWCSSNRGIFRFNPIDHGVLSFTEQDGLQGNEFNRYHFFQAPDGQMFFGGTQGWTAFYPDSVHADTYQPPTVITGISVNSKPLQQLAGWKDSLVTQMKTLKLPYDKNFITFAFAGLEYNDVGKLRYRYQLEGIDRDWVYGGQDHAAHYTGLPPGKYLFKVNAGNTAGVWSDSIRTMELVILPPWWRTWWAWMLYGLAVVISGVILYRNRIRRIYLAHQMALQQKKAAQLQELDEMKTRFFSNIAHELRTPLSLITAPLAQIRRYPDTSEVVRQELAGVQRNAEALLQLINQLLDLSKIEHGKMQVVLSRGSLRSFLTGHINRFEVLAAARKIELQVSGSLDGDFDFDADKWEKILSNLLSNAIRFTADNGRIWVHMSARDHSLKGTSMVTLVVRDNGMGIAEDQCDKVFDRFYQVDDSLTRTHGGTGIGLALTKELTELMAGTITLESEPEKGSCFRVSVPVRKASLAEVPCVTGPEPVPLVPEADPPFREVSKDAERPLILVVEDHPELMKFIARTLTGDYRVLTASHGAEALRQAEEKLPDLIISDVMMPVMDGYTLCERIKTSPLTSHIAFVLLSAKASHESKVKGLRHYADDYITKPFDLDELRLRISNILHRQRKLKDYYYTQFTTPEEPLQATQHLDNPFMCQLYQLIEAGVGDSALDVGTLADGMHVSRRTLNRKLSQMADLSAHELIRQYRLKKAAALLKTRLSVTETAYSVGFETPSYFSAAFKAFYGVSPSAYRRGGGA